MRRFIKMLKNSLTGKILKVLFKILLWALEILIVFLALVIVTQRVTGDQKAFLGFRIYNVATGSMEPEYAVGDILISREKDPSTIKVGDNIVYLGNQGGYDGKIITHNVIQVEQNENGDYLFHTKGRANTVEDPIVHQDQLYGTIVYNNEVLAFLCKILTNRYGLYFFAIIPITLYFFIGFIKVQGEKIEAEREEKRLEEERRRKKKKAHARKVQEMRRRQELEEADEIEEVYEDEENFEEEVIDEEEEIVEEEIVEEKPKTSKKSKSVATSKKKTTTAKTAVEKTKTTAKAKTTKESAKTLEKETKEATKTKKTENKEKAESAETKPKAATRKKAKEE